MTRARLAAFAALALAAAPADGAPQTNRAVPQTERAGSQTAAPQTDRAESQTAAPQTDRAAPQPNPAVPQTERAAPPLASDREGAEASIDALGAPDPRVVERAVAELAARARDADVLFAAGRASEDKLADPARALAIYQRIVAEFPHARVANAAERRIAELVPLVGAGGEHARLAGELAYLTAHADDEPAARVLARGAALTEASWPGAPRAAVWLADWLLRAGRLVEAQERYAVVVARWPDTDAAHEALRGGATAALAARNFALADRLLLQLPAAAPADRGVRDDLRRHVSRARLRHRAYVAAWYVVLAGLLALLASLTHAARRSTAGARLSTLRPPLEVIFLVPIAGVLIGVAFTAHRLIAPAVATISLGGILFAYLSGATLERLRQLGRPTRLRALLHIAICVASTVALSYIALTRNDLLDLLIETVRFGPET